jgi:hypothetical protein
MRLATFRHAGTEPRPAVLAGDDALVELPHADMLAFLEAGGEAMERARELATEPPVASLVPLDSVSLLALKGANSRVALRRRFGGTRG